MIGPSPYQARHNAKHQPDRRLLGVRQTISARPCLQTSPDATRRNRFARFAAEPLFEFLTRSAGSCRDLGNQLHGQNQTEP